MLKRLIVAGGVAGLMTAAAFAQDSRITMPNGWVVDVETRQTHSIVTNKKPSGEVESKLRYPGFGGEDGHTRLIGILSPEGAKVERLR